MFGDRRLGEDGGFLRIEARGQIEGCEVTGVVAKDLGIDGKSQGVEVGDEDENLAGFLEILEMLQSADIVAKR